MKKYEHLRKKAVRLRKQGLALDDICERVGRARGTVYYWIREIPLKGRTNAQSEAQRKGTRSCAQKYARLRQEAYDNARARASGLFKDPTFRDFIVIYLTEGYRKDRNRVSVVNSNEKIVMLSYRWLSELTEKSVENFRFYLQLHVDQNEPKMKRWWSQRLNIRPQQIKTIRKSNSGQLEGRNWASEHGVLSVDLGDTLLRSRLQAWMDFLQESWQSWQRGVA